MRVVSILFNNAMILRNMYYEFNESSFRAIPTQGNRAELVLTCLHRNNFGMDEFLGQTSIPLNEMDQYERPRSRWFKLQSKPGQDKKDKERGDLEIRTAFTVKAGIGSMNDLSKKDKNKSSLSNIASNVGGSLLSLGTLEKRKSLKKFTKSLGSKMHITGKKKKEKNIQEDSDSYTGSFSSIGTPITGQRHKIIGNNDPGMISEDEDEFAFDNLSHKSSGSSLNLRSKTSNLILKNADDDHPPPLPPTKPPRNVNDTPGKDEKVDEWETKLYGKHMEIGSTDSLKRRSWENSRVPLVVQEEQAKEQAKEKEREPTIEESELSMDRISLSSSPTAPASPIVPAKQEKLKTFMEREREESTKPKPLPRVSTAVEPIMSLGKNLSDSIEIKPISPISLKSEKSEKSENIFSKKLKNFRKERTPQRETSEQIRAINQYNKSNSGINLNGERIIIGGENNFNNQKFMENKVEVSKEILQKYDGKSKEVSL